jgi:foldase protein PrsA
MVATMADPGSRFAAAGRASGPPHQQPLPVLLMTKAVRFLLASCAVLAIGAAVAACGGVPGNAVATVDGTPIQKSQFDHWMNVAAKSSGQPNAAVPDPPTYASCIAAKRKTTPKPAKGQPKTTDAQLKAQCQQQYNQLRNEVLQLLISFQWIQGEAKQQGVSVTDAEVLKSFNQQKNQSFPKDADFQKFLKQSGQTQQDILQRVRLNLLSNKIRDKVIKGKDQVSDAQIQAYYNKNQARYSQPQRRGLRIVLTKTKAQAEQAKKALQSGQSWKKVAKKYSIDSASKSKGGQLPPQAKGTLEQALDQAVFSAKKGKLLGPVKTQFGYYVFMVTQITPASQQSLAQAKATIKQTLASQNQQKALNTFITDFQKRWRGKTQCQSNYKTSDCKNGPKPTPTPTTAGNTG